MGSSRRRLTMVGGLALVGILAASWTVLSQFREGGLFAVAAPRFAHDADADVPPEDLPPFVVRRDGRAGKIQPVYLPWQDGRGGNGLVESIAGCLPAGPGVDVLWNGTDLYLIKQKGLLKRIWSGDQSKGNFEHRPKGDPAVCFDGKYAWAALYRPGAAPRLIIVEPQSEQTWEFGAEHGLPFAASKKKEIEEQNAYFSVGPISPGKACIASWSGETQLAMAEFDPGKGISSKVFHRPAENAEPIGGRLPDWQALQNVRLKFLPSQLLLLAPPDSKDEQAADKQPTKPQSADKQFAPRLLIRRKIPKMGLAPSLLLDPATLSLEALNTPPEMEYAINGGFCIVHEGALYWLREVPGLKHKLVWARLAAPNFEEERLLSDMAIGRMAAYENQVCILGRICWLFSPGSQQVERVEVQAPWSSRGFLNVGASSEQQEFEGRRYLIDYVFPSQHYGVLATANTHGNADGLPYSERIFQFGLATDPRLAPDSPELPQSPEAQLAKQLPAGASASELRLYPGKSDGRPQAVLDGSVEASDDSDSEFPILAREIVRQAVLMAARDELRWTTRDGALRETSLPVDEATAKLLVCSQFSPQGDAKIWIDRPDEQGHSQTVWREQIALREDKAAPLDYLKLVDAAERWSRDAYPPLLRQEKLTGEANAADGEATVSPAAQQQLNQMTFPAQFAVLRELHHTVRKSGESEALAGALVRAYANLGLLTEYHWTAVHKACKARALLYAQRLVAKHPQSASALRHRAYAEALVGLHRHALDDLEAATKLGQSKDAENQAEAGELPAWVAAIEAYCRFDGEKLTGLIDNAEIGQLAGLLRFSQVESMKQSYIVQELARRLLAKNPECYRLFDAMCDSCALGMLHVITEAAPAVLQQAIPQRLQQLSGLPQDTAELLKRAAIRPVTLSELSHSLLETQGADDQEELSWTVLGGLLEEVEFLQIWRRAHFMRYQWAVPTEEFIAAVKPLAANHRFRALIDLYSSSASSDSQRQAAEQATANLNLADLDFPQLAVFKKMLDGAWKAARPAQYLKAQSRPTLHSDDLPRDLLAQIAHPTRPNSIELSERVMKVSPESPDAAAVWMQHHRKQAVEQAAELEQRFAGQPRVLQALIGTASDQNDRDRLLRAYIKLSPDYWAYEVLAESLKRQNKPDEWKATIDEFLEQPDAGLAHAQMRVQVANYYMSQKQYEQARPYAEAAAETWAEWAMLCAIRCYEGLGDAKHEGLWRSNLVERYPKKEHWLDWYLFCRRHGQEGAEKIIQVVDAMLADGQSIPDSAGYKLGTYYQASGRPKQALPWLMKYAAGEAPGWIAQGGLAAALTAHELGDVQARDNAFQRIATLDESQWTTWKHTALWLQSAIAANPSEPADLDAVRRLLDAERDTSHRGPLSYFVGRYLELSDRWQEAVPFYQAVAAEPRLHFFQEQTLARAALYDHGLKPDDDKQAAAAAKSSSAEEAEATREAGDASKPEAAAEPDAEND